MDKSSKAFVEMKKTIKCLIFNMTIGANLPNVSFEFVS